MAQEKSVSRPDHYAAFDGLRGLAAISVVLFHIGHWLNVPWLAANSDLAVGFFFCLSGYVMVLAYGRKLEQGISFISFVRIRLIRLMPIIVLGLCISFLYVLMRVFVKHENVAPVALVLSFALGLVNLPYLNAPAVIGGPEIFPLNGPQYSLFLEIVANFVWAGVRRLNGLIASFSLAVLCYGVVLWDGIGGDESRTFWLGFPRVGASFFLGIALFHFDKRYLQKLSWGAVVWPTVFFTGVAIMLVTFFWPVNVPALGTWFWIPLLSPLLILSGAKVRLSGTLRSLSLLGGALSYPIYALHYPLFCWINGIYQIIMAHRDVRIEGPLILVAVLGLSYLALRFVDEPLRDRLARYALPKKGLSSAP